MHRDRIRFLAAAACVAVACQSPRQAEPAEAAQPPAEAVQPPAEPGPGPMPEAWVRARVDEARARMDASEAGRLVWRAIEAAGGLTTWLSHGTVEFEFEYAPIGKPEARRHTFQRVDLWRSRARHQELGEGEGLAQLGYDGEQAWIVPGPDAFPSTARFWSTTPYYFLGMPFVAADPGTRYELLEDLEHAGRPHRIVKLSYGQGVGDSPGDYYILYLDAEQDTLSALRYVVAYPGFFQPGQHSPEKLMDYDDFSQVDGLRIAQRYDTYAFDVEAGEAGPKVTEVRASRIRFGQRYAADLFEPPAGAHVEPPL